MILHTHTLFFTFTAYTFIYINILYIYILNTFVVEQIVLLWQLNIKIIEVYRPF